MEQTHRIVQTCPQHAHRDVAFGGVVRRGKHRFGEFNVHVAELLEEEVVCSLSGCSVVVLGKAFLAGLAGLIEAVKDPLVARLELIHDIRDEFGARDFETFKFAHHESGRLPHLVAKLALDFNNADVQVHVLADTIGFQETETERVSSAFRNTVGEIFCLHVHMQNAYSKQRLLRIQTGMHHKHQPGRLGQWRLQSVRDFL